MSRRFLGRGHLPGSRTVGLTGRTFLQAQATIILVVGFFHVGTVVLCRLYVLFVIGHGSRRRAEAPESAAG